MNTTFRRYQLIINATKTKTMIFNFNGPDEDYPRSICRLGGHEIMNVKMFRYLGANVHYKDASTGYAEIVQRIDSAEAKYYQHAKKLMNFKISLRTRVQILNSLVRSRLTYGCHVWTLNTEQLNRSTPQNDSRMIQEERRLHERRMKTFSEHAIQSRSIRISLSNRNSFSRTLSDVKKNQ